MHKNTSFYSNGTVDGLIQMLSVIRDNPWTYNDPNQVVEAVQEEINEMDTRIDEIFGISWPQFRKSPYKFLKKEEYTEEDIQFIDLALIRTWAQFFEYQSPSGRWTENQIRQGIDDITNTQYHARMLGTALYGQYVDKRSVLKKQMSGRKADTPVDNSVSLTLLALEWMDLNGNLNIDLLREKGKWGKFATNYDFNKAGYDNIRDILSRIDFEDSLYFEPIGNSDAYCFRSDFSHEPDAILPFQSIGLIFSDPRHRYVIKKASDELIPDNGWSNSQEKYIYTMSTLLDYRTPFAMFFMQGEEERMFVDRWESDFVDYFWDTRRFLDGKEEPIVKVQNYGCAIDDELRKFFDITTTKRFFNPISGKDEFQLWLGGDAEIEKIISVLDRETMVSKIAHRTENMMDSMDHSAYVAAFDSLIGQDGSILEEVYQNINRGLKFDISRTLVDKNRKAKNYIQKPEFFQEDQQLVRVSSGIDYTKLNVSDPMLMLAHSINDPYAHVYLESRGLSVDEFVGGRISNYVDYLSEKGLVLDRGVVTTGLEELYGIWSVALCAYDSVAYAVRDELPRTIEGIRTEFNVESMDYAEGWASVLLGYQFEDSLIKTIQDLHPVQEDLPQVFCELVDYTHLGDSS